MLFRVIFEDGEVYPNMTLEGVTAMLDLADAMGLRCTVVQEGC